MSYKSLKKDCIHAIKDLGRHLFEFNLAFKYNRKLLLYKSYKMLGFINKNTFKVLKILFTFFSSLT